MEKLYNRQVFHNNSTPAINETNLNILTKAVDDIDNRVIQMDVVQDIAGIKADKAQIEREIATAETQMTANVNLAKQYRDEAFDTTPAGYEQVVAQVNTNKNDVSSIKSALTNFNLIDNGWFTVNQRGASSYSGSGYFIDRWFAPSTTTCTVTDNGVTVVKSGSHASGIRQYIEDSVWKEASGKTVTLSVMLADGTIYSHTKVCPTYHTASDTMQMQIGNWYYQLYSYETSLMVKTWSNTQDATIDFRAIKLEYGSISTLANDHAPNYADELLRCQCSKADSSDTFANQTHNFVTLDGYTQSKTYAALTWVPYPSGFNMDNTTIVAFVWKTDEDYYTIPDMGVVYPQLRSSNIAIYASGEEYTRGRQFKLTIMKI